jgi:tRNA-splicing ligase RtcB
MGWKAHFELHSEFARERAIAGEIGFGRAHKLHPEFYSKMGSENMTRLHQRPDFAARLVKRAPANLAGYNQSPRGKELAKGVGKRNRGSIITYNKSERGRLQSVESRKHPASCSRCDSTFTNHSEVMKHYHAEHKGVLNHKVVRVTPIHLEQEVPVYCLTASEHSNFALAAGVFVHNCGNKAVLTDMTGIELRSRISLIMADIFKTLSFGVGRKNNEKLDLQELEEHLLGIYLLLRY